MTYGLELAGLSVTKGVDIDPRAKYPYEQNTDADYVRMDVQPLADDPEPVERWFRTGSSGFRSDETKVLTGCAPCQPYSTMSHGEHGGDHTTHESWGLFDSFRKIVASVEPDVIATENVLQVANDDTYDEFVETLEDLGYHVNSDENKNVYAPEYGIPQKRKRWVLLASKHGPISLPEPPITDEEDYPTVRECIDHLPAIEAGEVNRDDELHRSRELSELNLERVENMEPGGDWTLWEDDDELDHLLLDCHRRDSGRSYKAPYGRMRPDEPSPTITTQFYNYGSGRFGHYDTDQHRAISLREGAMLQTFPMDYSFFDEWSDAGVTHLGRLIGNAVPPKLAEVMGEAIHEHLQTTVDEGQPTTDPF